MLPVMSRSSSSDLEKGVPPPRRSRGKCCCVLFCILLLLATLAIGGFAFYEYVIKPRIVDRYLLSDIEGNGSTTTSAPSRLQTVIPTATSPSFNGAVGGYIPAVGVWNKADEDVLDSKGDGSSQVTDQGASGNDQFDNSVGIKSTIITTKPTSSAYYASYPSSATTQDFLGNETVANGDRGTMDLGS